LPLRSARGQRLAGAATGFGPAPRRLGRRSAGMRGSRSAGASPVLTAARATRPAGRPIRIGVLVALGDLGGDLRPREALRAQPCRVGHPGAHRRVERKRPQLLCEGDRLAGLHQPAIDAVAQHVAVAGDVARDHGRAGSERLGEHHPEALTVQRGRADDVRARELLELALLGDLAERSHAAPVEHHGLDLGRARPH
jgi:hypothetical protein